jgi:hypothetical protein
MYFDSYQFKVCVALSENGGIKGFELDESLSYRPFLWGGTFETIARRIRLWV